MVWQSIGEKMITITIDINETFFFISEDDIIKNLRLSIPELDFDKVNRALFSSYFTITFSNHSGLTKEIIKKKIIKVFKDLNYDIDIIKYESGEESSVPGGLISGIHNSLISSLTPLLLPLGLILVIVVMTKK